jgi:DNA repair protein RadC
MKIKVSESMKKVTQPEGIYTLLGSYFRSQDGIDRKKEHFFVIHLDTRNNIKFLELVSIGILNASLVHPREVFCRAVRECSSQIILAHNHPSGDVEPSHEDIVTTKRLVQAGEILGISVIDHIVYSRGKFCSFKEQGIL